MWDRLNVAAVRLAASCLAVAAACAGCSSGDSTVSKTPLPQTTSAAASAEAAPPPPPSTPAGPV
ncbi:MAG: hypothetical protein ACR2JM_06585, partial [Mycobacterium sp.]